MRTSSGRGRMTILVTGAGGFVGANLVRTWARDRDVVAAVHAGSDDWRLIDAPGRRHVADLADADAIERMFATAAPTVVVNAAAHGAYSWQTDLDRMLEVNVHAVARLAELC